MQLNQAAREIIFKVVYYGPGMAGKTTNLAFLQRQAPAGTASELVTVDTHSERTLHFDMLALDLGQIQGHNVRVEFHTVPGQSYYAATRKLVLTGADAVVFVADSRREALDENIASMNEMLDNLRQLGMPSQIPVVLQYNKQDLPTAVRPEQLGPLMNVRNWPSRGACALNGDGVAECAKETLAMLADAAAEISLPEAQQEVVPTSWLISCHRCQAMLEVPDATVGAVYACGVCSATLEVVDPDRGLTRQPTPESTPVQPRPRQDQQPLPQEPSDYAMKTLPVQREQASSESALQPTRGGNQAPVQASGGGSFPLAGWEVLSFLDESPQGRRLRVRDSVSGRTCRALVLSNSLMAQPGYANDIEAYVRLAGPLKHPHILPLLEMRPANGAIVLLSADMPEHEPLGVVLGRRRALAPPHAMGLLRQVVLALEDAARAGVVHGWLRPECILVSPDGGVLVDEFAVPKNHRFLVRELAGASAATEYYFAPEHLGEDARSDLRSDMFLCGALLYRMITGDGLVTGYNAHEALHKLMAGGGKPLRSVGNTVSRDLDLFYRQLTALNRGERFESYRKLVEILDRFGGGAKRQNLRLTQPISAPGVRGNLPDSGTHQRSATGVHANPDTGNWRNSTGQSSPPARRSVTGEHRRPQRRRGGGVMAVAVVVIAVLAMVGAVAYVVMTQRTQPPPVRTPVPSERPAPSPQPVTQTPTRPVTPGTIGSVPPSQQTPEQPVTIKPEPATRATPTAPPADSPADPALAALAALAKGEIGAAEATAASVPAIADALPRLEAALKDRQEGRSSGPAQLSDRVTFDAPADLASFPDSAGTWQVSVGAAANSDPARLARRDAGTTKSVQIILTPSARRGSITLDFKGLKLAFDLTAGQFATQIGDKPAPPKPCNVVERVPNTLYLAYSEDGNHTTIELNGQVIGDVVMGDLSDVFSLAAAGGALMQVDEVVFTRAEASDPGRQSLRKLGWEPNGNATLDERTSCVLLLGAPNTTAGISCQVPASIVGYTIEVKGEGVLRLMVSGAGGSQHAEVKLAAGEAQRLTLRWAAGTLAVLDGNGVPLHSVKLERPVTSVSLLATGQCAIALPIRPNRL